MIARLRSTRTGMYVEVIGFSLTYVAVIAGFSYRIAMAAGIA